MTYLVHLIQGLHDFVPVLRGTAQQKDGYQPIGQKRRDEEAVRKIRRGP